MLSFLPEDASWTPFASLGYHIFLKALLVGPDMFKVDSILYQTSSIYYDKGDEHNSLKQQAITNIRWILTSSPTIVNNL